MDYRCVVYLLKLWVLIGPFSDAAKFSSDESTWPDEFEDCGGESQSPVALYTKSSKSLNSAVQLLYYNKKIKTAVSNNGHSINVDITTAKSSKTPTLKGGGLDYEYKAISFHFHWGSDGVKGSEHEIDDKKEDIEMHIIHIGSTFDNITEALKDERGTVVLGILFEEGEEKDSPQGLKELCNKLPSLGDYTSTAKLSNTFTLKSLLKTKKLREFFKYDGSLTTPPCTETVTWIVSSVVLKVSKDCLEKFWYLKNSHSKPLVNNFRKLQKLNGRDVYFYKDSGS